MANEFKQSSSHEPDLDWSQVRETVKMLHLSIAHITTSIHDGEESVDNLGNSFTSMGTDAFVINEIIENNKENLSEDDYKTLQTKCEHLQNLIRGAIVSFQFFDRFSQQLDHVCFSLNSLADIVSDPAKIYHPVEWHALQNQIRSTYSMDVEREVFDDFMKGLPRETIISKMKEMNVNQEVSDVEMF